MYGFNLGQIEGLDSSVQTVTLTIANETQSNTYTLTDYDGSGWRDKVNDATVELHPNDNLDGYIISISDLSASDLGKMFAITLASNEATADFVYASGLALTEVGVTNVPYVLFDDEITLGAEPNLFGISEGRFFPFENLIVMCDGKRLPYVGLTYSLFSGGLLYEFGKVDGAYYLMVMQIPSEEPFVGNVHLRVTSNMPENDSLPLIVRNLGNFIGSGMPQAVAEAICLAANDKRPVIASDIDVLGNVYYLTKANTSASSTYLEFTTMDSGTIKTVGFSGSYVSDTPLQAEVKTYTLTPNS